MMRNLWRSKRTIWGLVFLSIVGLCGGIFGISAFALEATTRDTGGTANQSRETARPDLINIDTMRSFGSLNKPVVRFKHDLHTKAVSETGGDCTACHKQLPENPKRISIKFMRTEAPDQNPDRQSVMNNYHDNCIECHNKTVAENREAGPVTCAECHREKPAVTSSAQPAGMDKSLHYRHSKALEKKCKLCHHQYNEKTEKLYYEEGTEGTCRYCHKENAEENRSAFRTAAHNSCVNCHLEREKTDKASTGPVKCAGCHDAEALQKIKKVSPVPRMERNQPDAALILTGDKKLDTSPKNRMPFVPFDHKAHETYNDTCRVCHHAAMDTCNECHSLKGKDEGDGITLEQAMHDLDNKQSCQGCHQSRKAAKECAGCHNLISPAKQKTTDICGRCHMSADISGQPQDKEEMAQVAKRLLEDREKTTTLFAEEDIPETITIGDHAEDYQPAKFPHRKIVKTLFEFTRKNQLAAYFHADKGTLCQGCHHNAPISKKPPRCGNCHGKPFKESDIRKPGIIGAYHIQCMECHTDMGIEKTGCTDCHKEKKK